MAICPKCKGPLGERPALSRRDNKTDICAECGYKEAIEDAEKIINSRNKGGDKRWLGKNGWTKEKTE